MAGWQVTEQAVAAMNNMSAQLQELAAKIHQESEKMKSVFEDSQDGLGAHSDDISQLISGVDLAEQDASRPLAKLQLKLNRAALIRQKHLEENRYGNHVGSTATGGAANLGHSGKSADGIEKDDTTREDSIRQKAVDEAWAIEKERVLRGRGTRDWTVGQQAELIKYGRVKGFEGQHMKNVARYPQYAGDPRNIQFLTYEEHLFGAHRGAWTNDTSGRFDPATGEMIDAEGDALPELPEIELTDKYDPSQYELTLDLGRDFGYARHEDIETSREVHKGEKSNGAMAREINGHK
jgi:hypothetical protein